MIAIKNHANSRKSYAGKDSRGTQAYEDSLKKLSDKALLDRLDKLRGNERELQRKIVLYISEVERRKLYLQKGYGSLFEFCTECLKYSRSSAARRIGAARCIGRFPRIEKIFRRGEIDITILSSIAGIINKDNCTEMIESLKGKSLREVEAYVAQRQPECATRDKVRQIFVLSTEPDGAPRGATSRDTAGMAPECKASFTFTPSAGTKTTQAINNKSDNNRAVSSELNGHSHRTFIERKFKLQFAVDPEFMEKLARVKSLLSTKYPRGIGFERLFDILLTEYLANHDPEERIKRRKVRRKKINNSNPERMAAIVSKESDSVRTAKSVRACGERNVVAHASNGKDQSALNHGDTTRASKVSLDRNCRPAADKNCRKKHDRGKRSRYVPQDMKDRIFERDGGKCSFVGPGGKQCGSRWNLHVDHIIPFAKGGDNSPENLRLLCARHNILEAEREFGKEKINGFIRRE